MRTIVCMGIMASVWLGGIAPAAGQETADLIITGGTVRTMNASDPVAEAVAVVGDRIVLVGPAAEVLRRRDEHTRVLELDASACVLPGLIDAHAHLLNLGRMLTQASLVGTESIEAVRERVRESQADMTPGEWIQGRGWDQNDWEIASFPTWRDLGGTEANPVYLRRVDGHAGWANRTALDRLGIDKSSKDPFGGRIVRDADGEPTGVLIDRADEDARAQIPEASYGMRRQQILRALEACRQNGLTGVHDAGTTGSMFDIYRDLLSEGMLKLRIYAILDTDDSTFTRNKMLEGTAIDATGYLSVGGIKIYADGALGSRGAALIEPYSDDSLSRGLVQHPQATYEAWARLAIDHGFQMCTHAIGDAGNRTILDLYERVLGEAGHAGASDRRFRIEHAQVLALDDIARFGKLGVIASMQPTHATSDMYWAEERVGPERIVGAYAWRRILDTEGVIACGSDFPVESVNPLWGIYAAVTRQDRKGWPKGGWRPEERMTVWEAVEGFTRWAAYAEFADKMKGTIEVGKLADFTIINQDIFEAAPSAIGSTFVLNTIVGGRSVYARGAE